MKNSRWKSLLINPFTRIAGWKAFMLGIVIVCVTVVIGSYTNIHFPGALDVKFATNISLNSAFIGQGIGLLSLVGLLYVAALIFARDTRFQDILGTITLSRFPMLLIVIFGAMVNKDSIDNLMNVVLGKNPFLLSDYWGFILCSLLMIPIIIWQLVLMYNAFSVSTGLKGGKSVLIYICAVIVAEIVSIVGYVLYMYSFRS